MTIKHIASAFNNTATLELEPPLETNSLSTHKAQPYYRSKAFVSHIGINPLIAATSPIFFLIEKCQQASAVPNLEVLHEDLTHEIKAFETQAQIQGYSPQLILAARYILCLWADETILNIQSEQYSDWENQRLTDSKHNTPEKSFFSLLDHCLQDTVNYIDLLELFYLCLSLGYEGEYRYTERGHMHLSELKDHLYHRIAHYRNSMPILTLEATIPVAPPEKHKKSLKPTLVAVAAIILFGVTITGYFLMNKVLTNELAAHSQTLAQLKSNFHSL